MKSGLYITFWGFMYKLAGVPGVARDDQWRNLIALFP